MVKAAQHAEVEALLAAGNYDGATQAFLDAGSYSDAGTQAATAHMAYIAQFDVGKKVTLGYYEGEEIKCWWWLRSSESYSRDAAYVRYDGGVNSSGSYVMTVTQKSPKQFRLTFVSHM